MRAAPLFFAPVHGERAIRPLAQRLGFLSPDARVSGRIPSNCDDPAWPGVARIRSECERRGELREREAS
eukprot:9355193-Pyramimonas_sp.AAC.1